MNRGPFRFGDRLVALDERAQAFLKTVAWLGGYTTSEQAQGLGVRNSVPRVHVQLQDFESWGFIKRVATYPVVYQVTKSVTRLLGADLAARRRHSVETIRTRLLAVNFYLEALHWPVEFVFDHQQKLAKFGQLGCEPGLLPQRSDKPYLWQDFVLQRRTGGLGIAMVDHCRRSAFLQLQGLLKRFGPCLAFMPEQLKLLVVTGTDSRYRLFTRLLRHPKLQKLLPDMPKVPQAAVKLYCVQRAVPAVRSLVLDNQDLRELRTLRLGRLGQGDSSLQLARVGANETTRDGRGLWSEEENESC